jgi:hypothetical protein
MSYGAGEILRPSKGGQGNALSGTVIEQFNHGLAVGDAVNYILDDQSTYIWYKAIADADAEENDSFCTHIVSKVNSANQFEILQNGSIPYLTHPDNSILYLSQVQRGAVTTTAPTSGFLQQLGFVASEMLHINVAVPIDMDGTSVAEGTVKTSTFENGNYKITRTRVGSLITIDLELKANNVDATFPVQLIEPEQYDWFDFMHFMSVVHEYDPLFDNYGSYSEAYITFNQLAEIDYQESFALSGTETSEYIIVERGNLSYFSNNASGTYFQSAGDYGNGGLPYIKNSGLVCTIANKEDSFVFKITLVGIVR